MKLSNYLVCLAAVLSVSACSSLSDKTAISVPNYDSLLQEQTQQKGRTCIRESDINGYGVLDDDVLSVSVGSRKKYYLVTTLYRCHSISTSPNIVFSGSFTEFCGGGRDKVLTHDEACTVKNIYEFGSRDDAFAAFETAKQTREEIREANKQLTAEKKDN